jgi:hypothetical protein
MNGQYQCTIELERPETSQLCSRMWHENLIEHPLEAWGL